MRHAYILCRTGNHNCDKKIGSEHVDKNPIKRIADYTLANMPEMVPKMATYVCDQSRCDGLEGNVGERSGWIAPGTFWKSGALEKIRPFGQTQLAHGGPGRFAHKSTA